MVQAKPQLALQPPVGDSARLRQEREPHRRERRHRRRPVDPRPSRQAELVGDGIGALADALSHALALRHVDNARYRQVLDALDPALATHPAVVASGGLGPFDQGLYGCSEMINEGFRRLVEVGVIRRRVVDKEALMRRLDDGSASDLDRELLARDGEFLHGAFYLGSPAFSDSPTFPITAIDPAVATALTEGLASRFPTLRVVRPRLNPELSYELGLSWHVDLDDGRGNLGTVYTDLDGTVTVVDVRP